MVKLNRKILLLFPLIGLFSCVNGRPPAPEGGGEFGQPNQQAVEKAADFFNKLGLAAIGEANYAKAIANFKRAVQINPRDPELWKNLGEAYMLAHFYKKAEQSFRRALTLKPDYGEVYYDLGILYAQWGKDKEALKWLTKAANLDTYGERYKAFYQLAHLYKKLGKEKEYEQNLKRAIDLFPRYKEALLELAHYYTSKGRYKEAERYYLTYLTFYPNDERVILAYAEMLAKAKKFQKAKKILKNLIDKSQNPQTIDRAYKLVQKILVMEAEEKLKQLREKKEGG